MVDKIIIDEKSSVNSFAAAGEGWAKEATLINLYKQTAGSNVYLNKLSKNTLSEKEFEKAQQEAIKVSKATGKIYESGYRSLGTKQDKNYTDLSGTLSGAFKNFSGTISSISSQGLVGTLKGFTLDASGKLSALADVTSGLSGTLLVFGGEFIALGAIILGTYDLAEKLNDSFSELYASGINFSNGIIGLTSVASDLGLTTGELTKAFTNYSAAVTTLGTKKTVSLIKQFTSVDNNLAAMGFTVETGTDAILEYAQMLRSTGMLANTSQAQLIKGANEYYTELNELSYLTGKNNKDLRKEQEDRRKNLPLNVALAKYGPEANKRIQASLVKWSKYPTEMQDLMVDALRSYANYNGNIMAGLNETNKGILLAAPEMRDALETMMSEVTTGNNTINDNTYEHADDVIKNEFTPAIVNLAAAAGQTGSKWSDSLQAMQSIIMGTNDVIARQKAQSDQADQMVKDSKGRMTKEQAIAKIIANSNEEFLKTQSEVNQAAARLTTRFEQFMLQALDPLLPSLQSLGAVVLELSPAFGKVLESMIPAFKVFGNYLSTVLIPSIAKVVTIFTLGFTTIYGWITKISTGFENLYNNSPKLQKTFDILSTAFTWVADKFTKLGSSIDNILKLFGYQPEDLSDHGMHTEQQTKPAAAQWFNLSNFTTGAVITGMAIIIGKVLAKLGLGTFNVIKTLASIPVSLGKGLARPLIAGGKGLWNVGKKLLGRGAGAVGDAMDPLESPLFNGEKVGGAAAKGMGGASKVAAGLEKAEEEVSGVAGKTTGAIEKAGSRLGGALRGLGTFITDAIVGITDTLGKASKGVGEAIGNLSKGIGSAISNLSEGIGKSFGSLLAGLGKGFGGLFEGLMMGLAGGLKAFASGPVAIGAGIFAAAIAVIGAGVAGATWIMGKALPTLAEGLKSFDTVDGANLKAVGAGMRDIGLGILALGAGEVLDAFSGLMNKVLSLFGVKNDPIEKFKRFGELAEPLGKVAPAMKLFADSWTQALTALNGAKIDDSVNKTIENLGNILFVDNKAGFWSGKVTTASKVQELADSIGSLAAKTAELQSAQSGATTPTGAKLLSPSDLQKRTLSFYDDQKTSNASLIQLLQMVNNKLDMLNDTTSDSSDDIVDAIKKASGSLY